MVSRSRSRSRGRCSVQKKKTWIAVCPCIITDDVTLEENSKMKVTVVQKEQYFFRSNAEFMVKITKWTGQDHVSGVHVTPQTVTLTDKRDIDVCVENPYDDRVLKLEHNDKVACLSILSCPVPRFSNSLAPDRYQTSTEKWFKMTTALLHKKGQVASITIAPGKTLKIIATIVGPVKRFVGMEVMVTEINSDHCPIDPQIVRIMENDCIGFTVTNRTRDTIIVEKKSQEICCLSVWARSRLEQLK